MAEHTRSKDATKRHDAVLDHIQSPEDVRRLPRTALAQLAKELRAEIVTVTDRVGGHFASSLGAVELVLGIHYVFDTPRDQLLWDMGYQAYAHKLITGRRKAFQQLKQFGGISGFFHKDESPYDLFTMGHGGTVISTGLGLATARDLAGEQRQVIVVIGDASLGEGMALEALNHAGHVKDRDLLVILNDNKMSIAPSIGAISRYLNRIIAAPVYNRVRDDFEQLLRRVPKLGNRMLRLAMRLEESVKGMIVPGALFEELGFRYFGPIDGNNLGQVIATLQNVKGLRGPRLVHAVTQKGKGWPEAERDPGPFHKVEPGSLRGKLLRSPAKMAVAGGARMPASFTQSFSQSLIALAERDPRVVAISAAMLEGTGLDAFQRRFPNRCVDVGMAEQHAVGMAAGLARAGYRPVVAIYSTFMQRAFDQIIHEVCLQELPVVLALDRASLVGEDGPTHHGIFDLAYLRSLPGLTVLSPRNELEISLMLEYALQQPGPVALRYARGSSQATTRIAKAAPAVLETGRAELLREGEEVALLGLGSMVNVCLEVADALEPEGIHPAVLNARFVKPIEPQYLLELSRRFKHLITVEEAVLQAGFGSAIMEVLEAERICLPVRRIGLPSKFIEHGAREILLDLCGLTPAAITQAVRQAVGAAPRPTRTEGTAG